MLSDTDKKELEEHFSKQYLLIPKNWVYYLIPILFFSWGNDKARISEVDNRAKQNIMAIEKNVTESQQRIKGFEQRIAEVEQACGKDGSHDN